jgi:20S proteasome alpha/beta subunit
MRTWTPQYHILTLTYHHIGSGAVYSFDPVGSYEREACRAAGAAQALVQPFLDNQVRCLAHSWVADHGLRMAASDPYPTYARLYLLSR